MESDLIAIARRCYLAYVNDDRSEIESIIAADFHFTSPLDNRLDRDAYFARCWPTSETIISCDFIRLAQEGDHVYVTYEGETSSGRRLRNTEVLTIRDGQIFEAEVYFGWSLPHEATRDVFSTRSQRRLPTGALPGSKTRAGVDSSMRRVDPGP